MHKQKQAFTLVELIVVITILAILGTIAFISLQGYSKDSRDSVRLSDVSTMKTALELFHLDAGKYPLPDNNEEITYETDTLWYQGTLGKEVVSQLSRSLNKIPTDPLTDKEYIFSTSWSKNDFQILNLLESADIVLNNTVKQTNAANTTRIPRVDGQYNGLFIRTPNYIFPTPSLITSEPITPLAGLVIDSTNIQSQIVTGGKNIPDIGNVNNAIGQLNITLSAYTGTINSESDDNDKINVINRIKGAYVGSDLANKDIYKVVLDSENDADLIAMANTVILDKTSKSTTPSDTEAPIGGDFSIPGTTSSTDVTLTITCPEEEGVEMFISGTGLVSGGNIWEECVNSKDLVLVAGNGSKEITVKWKDGIGNETSNISKNIVLTEIPSFINSGRTYYLINKGYNETDVHAEWQYDTCTSIGKRAVWGGCGDSNVIRDFAAAAIYSQGLNNGEQFGVALMDEAANLVWRGFQSGISLGCTNNGQGMCIRGYNASGGYITRCVNGAAGSHGGRTSVHSTRKAGGTWSICTD